MLFVTATRPRASGVLCKLSYIDADAARCACASKPNKVLMRSNALALISYTYHLAGSGSAFCKMDLKGGAGPDGEFSRLGQLMVMAMGCDAYLFLGGNTSNEYSISADCFAMRQRNLLVRVDSARDDDNDLVRHHSDRPHTRIMQSNLPRSSKFSFPRAATRHAQLSFLPCVFGDHSPRIGHAFGPPSQCARH